MSVSNNPQKLRITSLPLHWAVRNGDIEMIKQLIVKKSGNSNNLEVFSSDDECRVIESLLNENHQVNNVCASGSTPLHLAVEKGSEEIVELLVKNGADIESRNKNGSTALHIATARGCESIVELLLKHGARVDAEDESGKTPMRLAIDNGSETLLEVILNSRPSVANESNRNALVAALLGAAGVKYPRSCTKRYRRIAEKLGKHGLTINGESRTGRDVTIAAVEAGNLQLVEDLFQHGANCNISTTNEGYSLLHVAVRESLLDLAKWLIERGADVNAKDKWKKSSIYYSIAIGDMKMCQLLLSNGASVKNSPDLLNVAAQVGSVEMVEIMFQRDPEMDVNATDHMGRTALHYASDSDELICCGRFNKRMSQDPEPGVRAAVATLLLSRGIGVDARDNDGATALHYAASSCFVQLVQVLVKFGADVNRTDTNGRTPFYVSIYTGNEYNFTTLLRRGGDVNAVTVDGLTPLHDAAIIGNVQFVETLLEFGAKVNAADKYGCMPLHVAAEEGHTDVVGVLLKRGAKVNAKKKDGRSPLHCASKRQLDKVVEILIKHGANIDDRDNDGRTALHLASFRAQVSAKHRGGRSLLRCGNKRRFDKVVETLIGHGARIDERDDKGRTALHLASRDGNTAVVQVLLKFGADINVLCDENFTPFHAAYIGYRFFRKETQMVRKILLKHMYKLEALDGHFGEKNWQMTCAISELRSNFYKDCEAQVAAMKKETIDDTNVRFYDILTRDENKLALYVTNERIVKALEFEEYREKFPIYCDMISNRIGNAKKRKNLLNSSVDHFNSLFRCQVPDFIAREALSHLTNEDLKNLLIACSSSDFSE